MNYADFKKFDVLNGEGVRHSLFVSGCSHRCKGCFNASAWNKNYGAVFTDETEEMIFQAFEESPISIAGLSLLGGEPFENVQGLLPFLLKFTTKYPDKNIWCWSGYTFEQLWALATVDDDVLMMLSMIDILVDGKFILEQKDLKLKFRGSQNQRIIKVKDSIATGKAVLA